MTVENAVSVERRGEKKAMRPINWPLCVGAFFFGNILVWADRSNFSVAAAAWAREYHWTPSTIGLMLSAFSLGYLLMQPVGGWIADRLGPRRTFSLSMAGWSFWVLLTPLAPAVLWLTAAFRVLLGMSEAPFLLSIVTAISRAIPSAGRRGRFSGMMQSGAQLGPAAGVFFAGMILSRTGSAAAIFICFAAVGFLFSGGWWLYARRRSDPAPPLEYAMSAEAVERAAQPIVSPWKFVTAKRLWPLYIGYFALPYCQYIFLAWLPQYLSHYRHLSLANASFLSAFPFVVAFVAAASSGFIMDWFAAMGWRKGDLHRKFLIGVGALMYICATLIAANTASTMFAVYMIMVANAGLAFYVNPYWAIATDVTPHQGGTLSGVMNSFGIVGATISPALSGVIAQATGSFVAPLELAAAVMLVAATVAILFLKVRPLNELID